MPAVGLTPADRDRGRCPRPPAMAGPWPAGATAPPAPPCLDLARLRRGALRPSSGLSIFGNHSGGNAGVAGRRLELVVSEQCLKSTEYRCRVRADGSRSCDEACAARLALRSPAAFASSLNSRPNWRVVSGRWSPRPGKQPALLRRDAGVIRGRPRLPPLPQQVQDLARQHYVPILAALRLHDADDHLLTVDIARPRSRATSPAPQPATIGECQHRSRLQARRHREDTLDLLGAQHRRQLLAAP